MRKIRFIIIPHLKKTLLVLAILSFLLAAIFIPTAVFADGKITMPIIVIDAGHGGLDGGSVGVNGSIESTLALSYAFSLKELLESSGYKVYLTRSDEEMLADSSQENFKIKDMELRKNIIDEISPYVMISLHMNSFSDPNVSGAQVFFQENDEMGESFATTLQNTLISNFSNARAFPLKSDLSMLQTTAKYSVLLECGYLSNEAEEILLNTEEYKTRMCKAILSAIITHPLKVA